MFWRNTNFFKGVCVLTQNTIENGNPLPDTSEYDDYNTYNEEM